MASDSPYVPWEVYQEMVLDSAARMAHGISIRSEVSPFLMRRLQTRQAAVGLTVLEKRPVEGGVGNAETTFLCGHGYSHGGFFRCRSGVVRI